MRLTQTAIALALALLATVPVRAEETADAGAYLAARTAAIEADFAAAADWHARALRADPDNLQLLDGAMRSEMALGRFDRAQVLAGKLAALGERNQMAALAEMTAEAAKGEFAAMIKARADGRSVAQLLDNLVGAWAEAGDGRMSDALAALDKIAGAKAPEAIFGAYHKALALASVGDFEGADRIFADPANAGLLTLRRAVLAHLQVLSQLERGPEALALLDKTYPKGADAGLDALRSRLESGEMLPWDVVTTPQQGVAEVLYTLATVLNGQADDSYTLVHARAALFLRPDHVEAALMAGGLLNAQGQHDLAVETYAVIPPTAPEFYMAEIGRADTLADSGKPDAAIEVMQALSKAYPGLFIVQRSYGDALRRQERFEDATRAYDAAIALIGTPQVQDWPIFFSRGICHERQKRHEQAEADMRKALELSPDQPQVLNYLGYNFLELNKNLDEALEMIQRAVALEPDSGAITDSLAWAYFRLGRYDDAVAPMERASMLEPVDPVVTDHLGDVYWAVGRKLEARFQWRRALSFSPEEKEAERIRRKLEVGLDAVLAAEGAPSLEAVKNAAADNN
ncbi:tetratricopeptide repeat protein [Gemmobacter denitrificans]|uniref:Tetratricopeptide repeat protein n=1 Tax=Gemmobacter denitrificans TaxID=3123040 RepID=A0ABU8BU07_9RHOB